MFGCQEAPVEEEKDQKGPVDLGTAGGFVILAKSGIETTGVTSIDGNIGISPAAASYIHGFGLSLVGEYATSELVINGGKVYASDYAPPTPANMTTAVSNMETAFTDAAGRTGPDYTELYAGDISGQNLTPGLYKWGTNVWINTDVTLTGSSGSVWIFQISQDLIVASDASVLLAGGALPKNIYWQVSGSTSLNTTSHLEGVVLCKTAITLANGATVNGRLLSQTAVTLIANTIVKPAP